MAASAALRSRSPSAGCSCPVAAAAAGPSSPVAAPDAAVSLSAARPCSTAAMSAGSAGATPLPAAPPTLGFPLPPAAVAAPPRLLPLSLGCAPPSRLPAGDSTGEALATCGEEAASRQQIKYTCWCPNVMRVYALNTQR
jgi:hypothetical protein